MFFAPHEVWDSGAIARAVDHGFVVVEYRPDLSMVEVRQDDQSWS